MQIVTAVFKHNFPVQQYFSLFSSNSAGPSAAHDERSKLYIKTISARSSGRAGHRHPVRYFQTHQPSALRQQTVLPIRPRRWCQSPWAARTRGAYPLPVSVRS